MAWKWVRDLGSYAVKWCANLSSAVQIPIAISTHIENHKCPASWDPVDWESDSASDRIWRNLMNRRDLWSREDRRYAREMLKQVTEHEE